ncbi:MAG: family 20 glycosylhydrolase, partial [Bacteroidota bacterium]
AQNKLDTLLPVRGLAIKAPAAEQLDRFVTFVDEELSRLQVNLLILRVEYNYQYQSRPELADPNGLSKAQVKQLVAVCRKHNIRLIPQVNLLGHQSWHGKISKLLEVYPQFDETPWVDLPKGKYKWPNEDGLYCKSYCPLHPKVHEVVFDIVDEVTEVFEADAFHAGMDEVFYIGMEKCPRCGGRDKAELFAGEVTRIRNHLAKADKELWIWGDRLIDGKATGIGMWEASMNNTHRAIDMIPKDVVINDWHYERADPTAVLFAAKGFRVATCPWRLSDVAKAHLQQTLAFRQSATPVMKDRYLGMIHTIWTSSKNFLDMYYGLKENKDPNGDQVGCFKALYEAIGQL